MGFDTCMSVDDVLSHGLILIDIRSGASHELRGVSYAYNASLSRPVELLDNGRGIHRLTVTVPRS